MDSEKSKFLAGEPYQIRDPELMADIFRARGLVRKLNNLTDEQQKEKQAILRQLFKRVGKNMDIQPFFHCDFGYNISIGDNFLCNYDCAMLDVAPITIGDNCLFAPHVQIYAAEHPLDVERRTAMIGLGRPVTVGDNAWIGGGSILVPGVTLGNNVVVGAGSVVTKSFPDNVLIAGNPAQVIRHL
ncbi:MAG: sugar O-acetyltransferase [Clostridium sp.]|jgi:maltose O-acetyltransferase|uniref:sugar O-acetyltransferase n=1 Tax=Clostridium sp. TaxID=1506 RepID=UPI0025C6A043|nr:sugar O-acetyltransferase [Clostridium sp.]MCH3965036.1 sugar O-acetyltransferase [Clostridium sp.]MCI1714257.1 sugar O-acetyltransferase [Clostridium sp.]MCI1798519.1 sugar O-acetyltransferase [Clostridium sp.]MCI1812750.1 sugar O-acetyltransferase [Clostridium sp.]MCI1869328.1 sugar O-acetyltransferase [Clostridium sp.]